MTTNLSRRSLRRDKKGIGTVFGIIFFILIVVAVLSAFMVILDQNNNIERTAIQMRQADNERAAEHVTILRDYYPASGSFLCKFINTGTVPVQLVRVWIESVTKNPSLSFPLPQISLQQWDNWEQTFRDDALADGSPNDFNVWVVTARGNSFSYKPLYEGTPEPPSGTYWITATADPNSEITPRGVVSVSAGGSQTFTYSASPGYTVRSVIVDGEPIVPPLTGTYTFTNVQKSHTISVSTTVNTYTITASADSTSSITPSGTIPVIQGGYQTFVYWAAPGYTIQSVTVDGAPADVSGRYTFTDIQANHNIIVTSTPLGSFTITASAGPGGAISPSGFVTVASGASQSFTITANSGYRIADVAVDGSSIGAVSSYTFSNVVTNHMISASFSPNTYTITASSDSYSSISPSGTIPVTHGSTQTFTYSASPGYTVTRVLINGAPVAISGSYTFSNIQTSHTIAVSTTPNTYTITASSDSYSSISPSGTIPVTHGSTQTFTYSASPGYTVTRVLINGAPVAISGSYTFSNIQANHTIAVSTAINTYTITASAASGGTINPNGFVAVNHGGTPTFTITPITGFSILDVVVDGVSVGPRSSYTFPPVEADHMISATFVSWSARVSQGIGSLMMDFDDFHYYAVYQKPDKTYWYNPNLKYSGYSVNQAGLTGLMFRVKVFNADPLNRTITLNAQSVFWSLFPVIPTQPRGASWYLVNVDEATGRIQPSSFTTYVLPYTAAGTPVYLYFAAESPVSTSSSFQPALSSFEGTAPVNLAVIGTIAGNPYGQNLPFVSIIIRGGAVSTVTVTPSSGSVGTQVRLSGSGFVPYTSVTFTYDGVPITTDPSTVTVGSGGTFSNVLFNIPASIAGDHAITAIGSVGTAQTTFTVNPAITLTPISGPSSTIVSVSGSGFAASKTITATFDGTPITLTGTTTTDGFGSFSGTTFSIPATSGNKILIIRDANANTASAPFMVTTAQILLNPAIGRIGTSVTITGSNFLPDRTVNIQFDAITVRTTTSTSTGTISTTFTVPSATAGIHTVSASDGVNIDIKQFTVSPPSITLTPANGSVGTVVTVTGVNFSTSQTVTIYFAGTPMGTWTSTNLGTLPAGVTLTVPPSPTGSYTVTATDGFNTAERTFTITPRITLSPSTGPAGTVVTVSGTGFAVETSITSIKYNSTIMTTNPTTIITDTLGGFTAEFTVPPQTATTHTVNATDSFNNFANATFTQTPAEVSHFTFSTIGTQTAGTPFTITIQARDSYNNIVTTYTGTPSLTYSAGTIAPSSIGPFIAGVGTAQVTVTKAGTGVTITASDAGLGKTGTSNAFTVNPAALAYFTVSTPSNVQAGSAFTLTVTAYDAYGNIKTNYLGAATATLSDLSGSINPTSLASGWSNGVWQSSTVRITKTYTDNIITAKDGTPTGSSDAFNVAPGNLDRFTVTAQGGGNIGTQTAGTPFTITITAYDANNNIKTDYSGPATLSDLSTSISPTSTGTFTNGVATVTVSITKSYTNDRITATDSATGRSGTSNTFNINPAPLDNFAVTAPGGGNIDTQTPGTPFQITITARDQYGNTVTSFTGSTTLTDTTGTINPTTTTAFSSGTWTGTVWITKSSPAVTITASGSGKTGTSNPFNVNANLQLDGSHSNADNANSLTLTFTTTKYNDLIYISIIEPSGTWVTSITGTGVTNMQRRTNVTSPSSDILETWYGIASTPGPKTITINFNRVSRVAAVAFAISSADTTNPFDGTSVTRTGTGTTASAPITTTNPNTFIIGTLGTTGAPTLTPGTGFTNIATASSGNARTTADEYRIVNTPQTNLPVSYTWTGSQDWAIIADAIKAA